MLLVAKEDEHKLSFSRKRADASQIEEQNPYKFYLSKPAGVGTRVTDYATSTNASNSRGQ